MDRSDWDDVKTVADVAVRSVGAVAGASAGFSAVSAPAIAVVVAVPILGPLIGGLMMLGGAGIGALFGAAAPGIAIGEIRNKS